MHYKLQPYFGAYYFVYKSECNGLFCLIAYLHIAGFIKSTIPLVSITSLFCLNPLSTPTLIIAIHSLHPLGFLPTCLPRMQNSLVHVVYPQYIVIFTLPRDQGYLIKALHWFLICQYLRNKLSTLTLYIHLHSSRMTSVSHSVYCLCIPFISRPLSEASFSPKTAVDAISIISYHLYFLNINLPKFGIFKLN